MSTRARSDAHAQAIALLCEQAQAQRTALLRHAQPVQQRLSQGAQTLGSVLRALALLTAVAGGVGLLRHWLRPVQASVLRGQSTGDRLLHWMRVVTAALGAARLLAARLQR